VGSCALGKREAVDPTEGGKGEGGKELGGAANQNFIRMRICGNRGSGSGR